MNAAQWGAFAGTLLGWVVAGAIIGAVTGLMGIDLSTGRRRRK